MHSALRRYRLYQMDTISIRTFVVNRRDLNPRPSDLDNQATRCIMDLSPVLPPKFATDNHVYLVAEFYNSIRSFVDKLPKVRLQAHVASVP